MAPSSANAQGRRPLRLKLRIDPSPNVCDVELNREPLQIIAIDNLATAPKNASNVPKVLVGAAFSIIDEFPQDHVFGRREVGLALGKNVNTAPARDLGIASCIAAGDHEIDVVARLGVNDVELALKAYGLVNGRPADIKLRRGEIGNDRFRMLRAKLDDDIKILRHAGLAPNAAGERSDDRVGK